MIYKFKVGDEVKVPNRKEVFKVSSLENCYGKPAYICDYWTETRGLVFGFYYEYELKSVHGSYVQLSLFGD